MIEATVLINSDGLSLEGALTLPSADASATDQVVLLIASSGPLDRDQNSAKGKLNIFNQIAEHLAASGIASLRYDKRGCDNSEGDCCDRLAAAPLAYVV